MPHAQQHNPVQRGVRVPVPAARESMPCALSGGGGDRGDTGESGEAGAGSEPLGVVARGDQERRCGDRTDSAQGQQRGVDLPDEHLQLLFYQVDLGLHREVSDREPSQCLPGDDRGIGGRDCSGPSLGERVHQTLPAESAERLSHELGCGDQQRVDLVHHLRSGLGRRAPLCEEDPHRLDRAITRLWDRGVRS